MEIILIMAKDKLTVSLEIIWTKNKTDCSVCYGCSETIFTNMYIPIIIINKSAFKELDVKLCESCFGTVGGELI